MKIKTCQKPILFALCLLLMTSLFTFGAAAEAESRDYILRDEYGLEAPFDVSMLETLDELAASGTEGLLMDVRELADAECFEIVERSGLEETVYGAIYDMNGTYYYLNYVNLGNQHFDADGYFSYRSGEVVLTNAETYRAGIEEIIDAMYGYVDPQGEGYYPGISIGQNQVIERPIYDENGNITGYVTEVKGWRSNRLETILFWVGCVLLGLVAPVPFLVLGLVLSRSKKLGYPKYWRILSLIAIVWMVLAVVLMILLAIA